MAPPRWRRLGRALLAVAGGGTIAVTLMACYGAPAQRRPVAPTPPTADAGPDQATPDAGAASPDDTSGDDTEAPPDPAAAPE